MNEIGNQTEKKEIKITCKGADSFPIEALLAFQDNLKTLPKEEFEKLKHSIEKHGFSFPVFVWRNHSKKYIIDGHQRLYVLKKMLEDGYEVKGGKVPVDWIKA